MFDFLRTNGSDPQGDVLRMLVDTIPAMLAYWDADLKCRFANRAYEKWFGVTPKAMIGRDMKEFLGPLFVLNRPYVEGALRGEAQEFERDIPDPFGGPLRSSHAVYTPDIMNGRVRGFCVLVTDITRLKRAEKALQDVAQQLRLTERLAAMATLAAGIAHEINNPLASVLANIQFALENVPRDTARAEPVRAALVDAEESSRRVSQIVRSMQLFGSGDTTTREPVDVDTVLERSLELASNVVRHRARLVREGGGVGCIEGNAAQLAQVFVNLLVNAAQALPEERASRNELVVSTRREGAQIVIEVTDNGCGIPEDQQARIFEPFFTTKQVGAGMGLGLSVASGIVTAHHGTLTVRSKSGEGSTFCVVLPALVEARPTPLPPPKSAPPSLPSDELRALPTLLVVDDEVVLAHAVKRILGKEFEVTVAPEGRAAVTLLCEGEARFDVVLCDLMMPGMGGIEVYEEVTHRRPELASRFVFMTGGAFTPRGRAFLDATNAPVLEKPFDFARVRSIVRDVVKP